VEERYGFKPAACWQHGACFFPGCFGEVPDTSDFETTGKNFIGLSLYTHYPDGLEKSDRSLLIKPISVKELKF